MPTKRTYMQNGPTAKRTKTLTQEVAKLKKQVAQNKHEIKYYDVGSSISEGSDVSFFLSSSAPREIFVGRKIYVHKIEYSFEYQGPDNKVLVYRMRKGNGVAKASPALYPTGIDPELHTMLRLHYAKEDTDKEFVRALIDFKGSPRLVEFDDSDGTAQGTVITIGDIRFSGVSWPTGTSFSFRVWYHDG